METLKQKLLALFKIEQEFESCSALLKNREQDGKLDNRKLLDIIQIICDYIEEEAK